LAAAIIADMGKAIGGNARIEKRVAAAQGLSDHDGHALAGFLDAEGSFTICPNNGGRTWSCLMSVSVRLDDGDMLTDLARSTGLGLGRVAAQPARRGSRPQARWTIASKRECAELVRMLRHWPLRARKRRDFEIWAQAVDRWAAVEYAKTSDPVGHHAMARDAALIRLVRRYVDLPPAAIDGPTDVMLAYLGGFFSGARDWDRPSPFQAAYRTSRSQVIWSVGSKFECRELGRLLRRYPLRGRKRREFEIRERAVEC
jgi:LAGLIDADG endonuclease